MTWFEDLTGVSEGSPDQVRACLRVEGPRLESLRNGQSWLCGQLETPTLAELRARSRDAGQEHQILTVREVVANVQHLHAEADNTNALFQVASQFNLLEMTSPDVTPERGVGIYEYDHTQGPACAIAAGAGTIFRNYFAEVNGQIGQSADNQIDCLSKLGELLGNANQRLWEMANGYAVPSEEGLHEIDQKLETMDEVGRDFLRQALEIGLQWNTEVTLGRAGHLVSQAYCSAVPVSYCDHPPELWARFATLVLEASYEATLCAAIINANRTKNNTIFLTRLGGGAFGNDDDWITTAMRRALICHRDSGLDVAIVSYGKSNPAIRQLVAEFPQIDSPSCRS